MSRSAADCSLLGGRGLHSQTRRPIRTSGFCIVFAAGRKEKRQKSTPSGERALERKKYEEAEKGDESSGRKELSTPGSSRDLLIPWFEVSYRVTTRVTVWKSTEVTHELKKLELDL